MSQLQQWTLHSRVADKDVPKWRQFAKATMQMLDAELREKGLTPDHAPDMPPLNDGVNGFVSQPYRLLMTWIPDWLPHPDAGHHVVRVDTLIKSKAAA